MRARCTHIRSFSRAAAIAGLLLVSSLSGSLLRAEIRSPEGRARSESHSYRAPQPTLTDLAAYSLEGDLLDDCHDRKLDRHSLLEASLIASGIYSKTDLQRSNQRLRELLLELSATPQVSPREDGSLERRAGILFKEMHRRILTGQYKAECTELSITMDHGDYNCVTATLLFQWICRNHRLPVVAVAVPGHVFCQIAASDGDSPSFDVQTTCSDWFRKSPGERAAVGDGSIRSTPGSRRTLSDIELLAKVYYNRGVTALEREEFAEARRLLLIAGQLDPRDLPSRNNLLAGLNNWALSLSDRGQYAMAVEKLDECRACDASFAPLVANELHIHEQWARALCDAGRYAEAIDALESAVQQRPEQSLFRLGMTNIYGLWSASLARKGKIDDALAIAQRGISQRDERPDPRDMATVADKVRRLAVASDFELAAQTLQRAVSRRTDE